MAGHDVSWRGIARTPAAAGRPRLVVPRDDRAVRVEPDALVDHEQVAVVLPRHLVLAGQLHAHRPAHCLRQHRRVVAHGVGAVDAVAAGAAHVDDAHALGWQAEEHRGRVARGIRRLGRRPQRRGVRAHVGDRARAAHRAVHLVGVAIGGAQHRRGLGERRLDVAGIHQQRVARRLAADVLVGGPLRGERGPRCPRDLELRRGLHGLPGLLRDDADEVALGNHLHDARHRAHRGIVDPCQCRADAGRPHHPAVQHPGHLHRVHELGLAGHKVREIDARHRGAQHLPRAGMPALRRRVERQVEAAPAEKRRVAHLLRRVRRGAHHAIGRRQTRRGRHPADPTPCGPGLRVRWPPRAPGSPG